MYRAAEVNKIAGEGSFGICGRAVAVGATETVVLKSMRSNVDLIDAVEEIDFLQRLGAIGHPNIIRLLDVWWENTTILAFEDGGFDLAAHPERPSSGTPLPINSSLNLEQTLLTQVFNDSNSIQSRAFGATA